MDGVRVGDCQGEDLRSPRHEHHLCCCRPLPRAQFDCQEQVITEETTQNTFENQTTHEHVIVQEISQAPLHCCVFSRILIEFGLVFLLVSQSVLDLTVDFGTCVMVVLP